MSVLINIQLENEYYIVKYLSCIAIKEAKHLTSRLKIFDGKFTLKFTRTL